MARQKDAQKFIGESRAPRVQIEYDVELYGSQKKVELPFVTGVMADLSGDNDSQLGPVEDRRFMEIDDENFDQRMAEIVPALDFFVPNLLTDDGTLINIDLEFNSMEDFEPAQMVRRIPELAVMLEARSQLKELITYMDGKAAAEDIVQELLKNPAWADAVKLTNPTNASTSQATETPDGPTAQASDNAGSSATVIPASGESTKRASPANAGDAAPASDVSGDGRGRPKSPKGKA